MKYRYYQDGFFLLIDLKVNSVRKFFQEENSGVFVPNLRFEWVSLNTVNYFTDMTFKQVT